MGSRRASLRQRAVIGTDVESWIQSKKIKKSVNTVVEQIPLNEKHAFYEVLAEGTEEFIVCLLPSVVSGMLRSRSV